MSTGRHLCPNVIFIAKWLILNRLGCDAEGKSGIIVKNRDDNAYLSIHGRSAAA